LSVQMIMAIWLCLFHEGRCGKFLAWRLQLLTMSVINSLNAPTEVVKQIIINIEAGVEVEVTIAA